MLSELYIQRIYKALNYNEFRSSDFSISQVSDSNKDSGDPSAVFLTITYRYKKEFSIKARASYSSFVFVEVSPGEVMEVDHLEKVTSKDFISIILNWVETLSKYFSDDPISRNVYRNQKKIDELENKIDEALGDLDEEFLDEEISLLKQQLNNMEKELTERLNQHIQDQEILKQKIKELHRDVYTLKAQAGPLNKKNWLLSYYTKMYLWNMNNPTLLPKSLLQIGHKFLPESVQNLLPSEIIDSTVDSLLTEPRQEESKVGHK